jgi:hypothetical protein
VKDTGGSRGEGNPVGVRHHCVWCGVVVRHPRAKSPVLNLATGAKRRVVGNYRLTAARRAWLPEEPLEVSSRFAQRRRDLVIRVMPLLVVVFPVVLGLTGAWAIVTTLVYEHVALVPCIRQDYLRIIAGRARACGSNAETLTELPIYLDIPSALGAASSLGMWILHRRLTFLMLHLPRDRGSNGLIEGNHGLGGHRNALSDPDRPRFFLFQEEWALKQPFRLEKSRLRGISLILGLAGATALFICYYLFGGPFRDLCGSTGVSSPCAIRSNWWANPSAHPLLAAGWILTVGIAATLGFDNFVTTTAFQRYVADALSPPDPGEPDVGEATQHSRTARLTEHFPALPSSWTFLQAFLAELRLGWFIALTSLATVLAMFTLGAAGRRSSLAYLCSAVLLAGAGAALLARRRRFEATLTTAANEVLATEVDKILSLRNAATDGSQKQEATARMEWLLTHGSLPPVKLDERLKTYAGWAVGAVGLLLALYQSVH